MNSLVRKFFYAVTKPRRLAVLDYPIEPKPLYEPATKPHEALHRSVKEGDERYAQFMEKALQHKEAFAKLPLKAADPALPSWENDFFPTLDTISLYTVLAQHRPKNYVEIGSGNSTKVAHYCRTQEGLNCRIACIDPFPRAEVKEIADQWEGKPIQAVSLERFRSLQPNDVVFFDGSHVLHPNSDVMWFFLEVLPAVPRGVIVHIHDIYLPYDYPQWECDHYYSEQYMLAACFLNSERYKVLMPVYHVWQNNIGVEYLNKLWELPNFRSLEKSGRSFWFVKE